MLLASCLGAHLEVLSIRDENTNFTHDNWLTIVTAIITAIISTSVPFKTVMNCE